MGLWSCDLMTKKMTRRGGSLLSLLVGIFLPGILMLRIASQKDMSVSHRYNRPLRPRTKKLLSGGDNRADCMGRRQKRGRRRRNMVEAQLAPIFGKGFHPAGSNAKRGFFSLASLTLLSSGRATLSPPTKHQSQPLRYTHHQPGLSHH